MNERAEQWSERILSFWLPLGIGLLIFGQFAVWIPHYLTWPFWPDHDVFANAARSWTYGELPYRDVRLNNFPGTIYLFWILGKVVGWGRPWAFYALDLTLLLTLGILLIVWSRRQFAVVWPGMLGFLVYLSTALALDYTLAAQRDWQGPVFVLMALLILQAFQASAPSLMISAALAAAGFSIRPQVVLLWPALLIAAGRVESPGWFGISFKRSILWIGAVVGFTLLLMMPLVWAGVFDDFLHSLRMVVPGGSYNQTGIRSIPYRFARRSIAFDNWVIAAALIVLTIRSNSSKARHAGWEWLIALAGASLYAPISPANHAYLMIPIKLVAAISCATIFGFVSSQSAGPASLRLLVVLGIAGLGNTTFYPPLESKKITIQNFKHFILGTAPEGEPPGYRPGPIPIAAYHPWEDYRGMLDYLQAHTTSDTFIANLVREDIAIVSMIDRRSALPAESSTWLRVVRSSDSPQFEQSLKDSKNSVAVWNPTTVPTVEDHPLYSILKLVPELYEFEARFGELEVWRRKPEAK